jgi:hypothetical protein
LFGITAIIKDVGKDKVFLIGFLFGEQMGVALFSEIQMFLKNRILFH